MGRLNSPILSEFTFSDSSNFVREGKLVVTRKTTLQNTEVCNTSLVAATGTIECNLTSYVSQSGQFVAVGWIDSATTTSWYAVQSAVKEFYGSSRYVWGTAGAFYALLIVIAMALLGLWNPNVTMIMGGVGMIVCFMLGLIPIGIGWLVGLIVVIVMSIKMNEV